MSKEFTKSYAINRIAELNEQIVEMTDNQNQTMRYLNRIRDENKQLKQQLEEKDKEIEKLKIKQKPIVMHSKEDYFQRCNFLEEENIKLQFIQTKLAIQELEKVKNYFIEECEDGDGIKTEDRVIKKDIYEVADFIENQIKELKK